MKLGNQITDESGKITGTRILEFKVGEAPKFEMSFQGQGKILGVGMTNVGTFWAVGRAGGTLYAEGRGVAMTKEGDSIVWTANGVGKPLGPTAGSWRYSISFQTTSQKLARLNGIFAVGEFEVDENGNLTDKVWEVPF